MGYPSKRYKISPTASFSVLVSIVPSKYDFFLPFLITLDLKIFIFRQKKLRVSASLAESRIRDCQTGISRVKLKSGPYLKNHVLLGNFHQTLVEISKLTLEIPVCESQN